MRKQLLITLLGLAMFATVACIGFTYNEYNPVLSRNLEEQMSSTVLIEIDGRHTGSGFIVSALDGRALIITARHVVDRRSDYAVLFEDGTRRDVQAIRISKSSDCAVLLVHKANLRPLILTEKVRVGQSVTVIGNPLDPKFFNYMTRGIVSKIGVMDDWLSDNHLIMIDAAINPGNSGGPVFDARGRVIGIAIAGYVYNCGMNFITPSIDIAALLEEWKDEGANWDERLEEAEEAEEEFTDEYEAGITTNRRAEVVTFISDL